MMAKKLLGLVVALLLLAGCSKDNDNDQNIENHAIIGSWEGLSTVHTIDGEVANNIVFTDDYRPLVVFRSNGTVYSKTMNDEGEWEEGDQKFRIENNIIFLEDDDEDEDVTIKFDIQGDKMDFILEGNDDEGQFHRILVVYRRS